jgi:hypothetical protein
MVSGASKIHGTGLQQELHGVGAGLHVDDENLMSKCQRDASGVQWYSRAGPSSVPLPMFAVASLAL